MPTSKHKIKTKRKSKHLSVKRWHFLSLLLIGLLVTIGINQKLQQNKTQSAYYAQVDNTGVNFACLGPGCPTLVPTRENRTNTTINKNCTNGVCQIETINDDGTTTNTTTGTDGMPADTGMDTMPADTGMDTMPADTGMDTMPADTGADGMPADTTAGTDAMGDTGGGTTKPKKKIKKSKKKLKRLKKKLKKAKKNKNKKRIKKLKKKIKKVKKRIKKLRNQG